MYIQLQFLSSYILLCAGNKYIHTSPHVGRDSSGSSHPVSSSDRQGEASPTLGSYFSKYKAETSKVISMRYLRYQVTVC